jgi:hypothetical protein
MNFFEKILKALDLSMTKPTPYGWFHLMWLAIVAILIVVVCLTCKKLNSKQFRTITLIVGITLILFEIYKQLNFSFDSSNGTWSYHWYAFPFQFCSTPMYVLLLIGIIKENKFSNYLCCFMASFGLFAGLVVMLYPNTVFVSTIGINIQTMLHHGMMLVMGVFMIVSGRAKLEHKTILKGGAVFLSLLAIAFVMNIVWHFIGINQTFNMFYISPFYKCELVILDKIQEINYVLFLFTYIFGFLLAGYLMILISMGFDKLSKLIKSKKDGSNQNTDTQQISQTNDVQDDTENKITE